MVPLIAIHAMVYKYQKRAWWQLSSLMQQVPWQGHGVPPISYTVSAHAADPYAREFEQRCLALPFPVISRYWNSDAFGERGHIRTRNLQDETAEFLLFVDADMVYEPEFLAKLGAAAERHRGDHRVLAVPRMSMSFEDGYSLVDPADYSKPIESAWTRATAKKTWWSAHGRISGAGFFQLVHLPSLRGYMQATYGSVFYVRAEDHRDANLLTSQAPHNTRSDRSFRLSAGGIVAAPELRGSLHLNHWRRQDPQCATVEQH